MDLVLRQQPRLRTAMWFSLNRPSPSTKETSPIFARSISKVPWHFTSFQRTLPLMPLLMPRSRLSTCHSPQWHCCNSTESVWTSRLRTSFRWHSTVPKKAPDAPNLSIQTYLWLSSATLPLSSALSSTSWKHV